MLTADKIANLSEEEKRKLLNMLSDVYIGATDDHDLSNWGTDKNGELILLDAPNEAHLVK